MARSMSCSDAKQVIGMLLDRLRSQRDQKIPVCAFAKTRKFYCIPHLHFLVGMCAELVLDVITESAQDDWLVRLGQGPLLVEQVDY